jgi:simple sugar transport system substrate-binding protein
LLAVHFYQQIRDKEIGQVHGSGETTMKTNTIATVVKVKNGHAWFDRMETGVKKFGKDTGQTTYVVGPSKADEKLQEKIIEDLIAQGVQAICIVPFFPKALEMVLGKARRQGIVVISHEADNLRNVDYDLEAFDNTAYGIHLMDHLARYMSSEGQYGVLVGSLMSQSHNEWSQAAIDRQKQKYPIMSLATRKIEDRDDPTLAHTKTEELIASYPNLKGILTIGMTASIGAGSAIEERKMQDKIVVVGTGLTSVCGRYLLSGAVKLASCWDPADAGYVMNKLALMVLERQKILDGMDLGVRGYTQIKMTGKILYGSAMLDITKENMTSYPF